MRNSSPSTRSARVVAIAVIVAFAAGFVAWLSGDRAGAVAGPEPAAAPGSVPGAPERGDAVNGGAREGPSAALAPGPRRPVATDPRKLTVVSPSGAPVVGAAVHFVDLDGESLSVSVTDADGVARVPEGVAWEGAIAVHPGYDLRGAWAGGAKIVTAQRHTMRVLLRGVPRQVLEDYALEGGLEYTDPREMLDEWIIARYRALGPKPIRFSGAEAQLEHPVRTGGRVDITGVHRRTGARVRAARIGVAAEQELLVVDLSASPLARKRGALELTIRLPRHAAGTLRVWLESPFGGTVASAAFAVVADQSAVIARFAGLEPDRYTPFVSLAGPPSLVGPIAPVTVEAGATKAERELQLGDATLVVDAVAASGTPPGDVRMELQRWTDSEDDRFPTSRRPLGAGSVEFRGLPEGRYGVRARAGEMISARREVTVTRGSFQRIALPLGRRGFLTLRLPPTPTGWSVTITDATSGVSIPDSMGQFERRIRTRRYPVTLPFGVYRVLVSGEADVGDAPPVARAWNRTVEFDETHESVKFQ